MLYKNIKMGRFIDRPNRFIAYIEINGEIEVCHVKNTGRCKELLIPGVTVFVQEFENPKRKTKFDLISVIKGDRVINIDSQVPNKVVQEWLMQGHLFEEIILIKPEAKYKKSRFDFYVETKENRIFIEVKGVTLEENNIALFPDAPTERGVKHIKELIGCVEEGYLAYIVFVIQMKDVKEFSPNVKTHREFSEALNLAQAQGVKILAFDCNVDKDYIQLSEKVEVKL